MPPKTLSEQVVSEVLRTVTSIGHDKTIDALKSARENGLATQPQVEHVINTVCTQLSVSFVDMIDEQRTNADNIAYAKGFMVHYLRTKLNVPWTTLKILLKRDQSQLYRDGKLIKDLNPNSKHDQPYCDHKKKLDETFKKYKLKH